MSLIYIIYEKQLSARTYVVHVYRRKIFIKRIPIDQSKKEKERKKRENSTRVAMEGGNMTDVGKLRSTTIQHWVQLLSATVWNKSETKTTTITTTTFSSFFCLKIYRPMT